MSELRLLENGREDRTPVRAVRRVDPRVTSMRLSVNSLVRSSGPSGLRPNVSTQSQDPCPTRVEVMDASPTRASIPLGGRAHPKSSSFHFGGTGPVFVGEFDPGSGRTLAACLTHVSRTGSNQSQDWGRPSGERVRNTCETCPDLWDNSRKRLLIPDTVTRPHGQVTKDSSDREGLAAYQLVGEVTAHQGIDG